LNADENRNQEPGRIGRRDFLGTSGTIAVAAASWWAVTEKTDALAQAQNSGALGGGNPTSQDYHYDDGM
jgi:hypothetical protein